jgi:hypothetical protein
MAGGGGAAGSCVRPWTGAAIVPHTNKTSDHALTDPANAEKCLRLAMPISPLSELHDAFVRDLLDGHGRPYFQFPKRACVLSA